ncbi:MAG TPA: heparan-alpha-glucosaminide N-acetyltransferase [archaeon]|nr:heparan-alpha-glucosaminide N-acetyltransferase [archaeon]
MRFWELDFLRGIAICMMVLFHLLWDFNYFGIISIELYSGAWGLFQKATAALFLLLLGILLTIGHDKSPSTYAKRFFYRAVQIFCLGILLSLATYIFYPSSMIYFGILHLIGVSIFLSIFFVQNPKLSLAMGAIAIVLPRIFDLQKFEIEQLFWAGFASPASSLDFFPLLPWVGVVLIGIFVGKILYGKENRKFKIEKPKVRAIGFLEFLGRHSLLIYFAHQLVLFPLAMGISYLL